jgi:UDP-glucose 4-epimerase
VGHVFNIGNTEEISILDLAERIRAMTSSHSAIEFVPYEKAYEAGFEDMPRRVPDLTKIAHCIGYRPTIGLDEILRRVIEHTRTTLDLEKAAPSAMRDNQ